MNLTPLRKIYLCLIRDGVGSAGKIADLLQKSASTVSTQIYGYLVPHGYVNKAGAANALTLTASGKEAVESYQVVFKNNSPVLIRDVTKTVYAKLRVDKEAILEDVTEGIMRVSNVYAVSLGDRDDILEFRVDEID